MPVSEVAPSNNELPRTETPAGISTVSIPVQFLNNEDNFTSPLGSVTVLRLSQYGKRLAVSSVKSGLKFTVLRFAQYANTSVPHTLQSVVHEIL